MTTNTSKLSKILNKANKIIVDPRDKFLPRLTFVGIAGLAWIVLIGLYSDMSVSEKLGAAMLILISLALIGAGFMKYIEATYHQLKNVALDDEQFNILIQIRNECRALGGYFENVGNITIDDNIYFAMNYLSKVNSAFSSNRMFESRQKHGLAEEMVLPERVIKRRSATH